MSVTNQHILSQQTSKTKWPLAALQINCDRTHSALKIKLSVFAAANKRLSN